MAYDAMGIYAGAAAQDNVLRGLHTRTWGFPVWTAELRQQPDVRFVLIASRFSGGSPRVRPPEWAAGTVDVHLCRFVGPFVEGRAPHWEDELAEGTVKYPCRFGIEPVAYLEGVSLAAGGPLGADVAEAIRLSAASRGVGRLVGRWSAASLRPGLGTDAAEPSAEVMTDDLPVTGQRRRRGLGRMSDAAMRRAVERRAMDVVHEHYAARGWTLTDTSATRPWDFEATRDGELVRIEVKGTTGLGTHVQLTAGEVVNVLGYGACALAVVSDIRLDTTAEEVTAAGGRLHVVHPWRLDETALRALSYEYRVPPRDEDG